MSTALSVHVEQSDSMALVFAGGELDCSTGPTLVETCTVLVRKGVDDLGVDCGEVDFIDCAGVTALVDLARLLRDTAGTAFLVNVPPRMRWLLDVLEVELEAVQTTGAIDLGEAVPRDQQVSDPSVN